jgi:signal peptidase I
MGPWFLLAACALAVLAVGAFLLRRQFAVVRVRGNSMLPALWPGERLLVRRARCGRLGAGVVVVLWSPAAPRGPRWSWPVAPSASPDRWIVKRVAALPGDAVPEAMRAATGGARVVPERMLLVSADNPAGSDSRQWGFVQASYVLGPVVRKLSPSEVMTAGGA